jgi:uncharacterized membrane protein YeaQ/YmgE (transglycosylase-associated protein family)
MPATIRAAHSPGADAVSGDAGRATTSRNYMVVSVAGVLAPPMHLCHGKTSATPRERGQFMDILLWIIFGLVVGAIAKLLMPGRDPGGFILTIVIGIVGALLGGWVGRAIGLYREGEPVGFIMAVVGAILLLVLYRLFTRRSAL